MNAPARIGKLSGRKVEALSFIAKYIALRGHSPTMQEIGDAMVPPVSKNRAKQLVHQLAVARMIERSAGSQRGISVPGLLDLLAQQGFVVNPSADTLVLPGFPKGQLPVLPKVEHVPDDF